MRQLKLPVPTSIITGSLGVGKTTALCKLVFTKPANEHWCIIVNEFGAVGIDVVALQSSAAAAGGTVAVKQIAGGCMCCAQSGVLLPAIAQIIRQTKPDRLLIEPSGLGHPGGLLDILQGPHLGSSLQINAIVCLVDLSTFDPKQLAGNQTAWDQVTIADILVGSKADVAAAGAAEQFQRWATEELFPPKADVMLCQEGNLDPACLLAPRSAGSVLVQRPGVRSSRARGQQQQRSKLQQTPQHEPPQQELSCQTNSQGGEQQRQQQGGCEADAATAATHVSTACQDQCPAASGQQRQEASMPHCPTYEHGKPQRILGQRIGSNAVGGDQRDLELQHSSCGWVFCESDVFDRQALLQLLQAVSPVVARIKGVFKVGQKQWVMPAAAMSGSVPAATDPIVRASNDDSTSVVAAADDAARSGLQLQGVCYRGTSMVEVILVDGKEPAAQTAAIVAALSAARHSAHLSEQQQQASHCGSTGPMQEQGVTDHLQQMSLGHDSLSRPGSADSIWLVLEQALLTCIRRS